MVFCMKRPELPLSKMTKINGLLHFDLIEKSVAKKMIIENHYSHSWYHMFGKANIGVFKDGELLGVASYGAIKVPKSFKSISEDIEKNEIVELNRLWIDDKLGKNAESVLISKSISILKHYFPEIKVIQSFADGRLGCGGIYQATNFGYYGFHETEFFENKETGRCFHEMVFHTSSRPLVITRNLEMLDDRFVKFKTRTYRYLYLIDPDVQIKLEKQSYPKEEPYKKYLDWVRDDNRIQRWINNCLKYQFVKLEKEKFTFTFDDGKYTYTKEMWEQDKHPKELLKKKMLIQSTLLPYLNKAV